MSTPRNMGSRSDRTDRVVLWLLLGLGTLLMLVAAGARGEETANRTDRITATLPSGSTLRLENVSGDVVAVPGREFSAVATIVVAAPDRKRAQAILERVRIVQQREGNELSIETQWPESRWRFERRDGRSARRRLFARCEDCRINARYDVTLPPGVTAVLGTVNGNVRVRDLDGDLRLSTVNGKVEATGVRRSLAAESVNGDVVGVASLAPPGSSYALETVNGAVRLTLPKDARFDLSASTMRGSIASTFALPVSEDAQGEILRRRSEERIEKKPVRKVIVRQVGSDTETETVVVDLKELEKELEQSMKNVDVEIRRAMQEVAESISEGVADGVRDGVRGGVRSGVRGGGRGMRILNPRRSYSGRIGDGGSRVRLSALNGSILLLAAGSRPEDAKPIVAERRSFVVTIPNIQVRVPEVKVDLPPVKVRVPPVRVDVPEFEVVVPRTEVRASPRVVWAIDAPVHRGDVAGDFLSASGTSSYRIGNVSGRVKILTHAGQIVVASAGAGADVKTLGGDIRLGPVKGDLAAQTLAGDVRAAAVAGSAKVETSGGDIRIQRVDGWLHARTAGGDIVVPVVGGSVNAETAGGDVRIAVSARQLGEGISIVSGGGDVALTLPADFRGDLDLTVTEADPSERAIRSEFPEVSTSRQNRTVRGTGAVNGGGEKVRVQTSSGTIHLSRGPAAQK